MIRPKLAVVGKPANDEMVQGYMDGLDVENPEPSANRSASYRHGFANGRDDRKGKPRASFKALSAAADAAMAEDESNNLDTHAQRRGEAR
jgi:hypothetical protein